MVRKKAHGCAVGLLAFSPISRFPLPILPAAQLFSPVLFYYNYVYIILIENTDSTALSPEIAICHWWRLMVESLLQSASADRCQWVNHAIRTAIPKL